jgi:hypothetical protein
MASDFSYDFDFNQNPSCQGGAFWIIYIIFVLILGIISISMTASLLRNQSKGGPYSLHVLACFLFFIAGILVVVGWKWTALIVSLINLGVAIGAIVGIKPDQTIAI